MSENFLVASVFKQILVYLLSDVIYVAFRDNAKIFRHRRCCLARYNHDLMPTQCRQIHYGKAFLLHPMLEWGWHATVRVLQMLHYFIVSVIRQKWRCRTVQCLGVVPHVLSMCVHTSKSPAQILYNCMDWKRWSYCMCNPALGEITGYKCYSLMQCSWCSIVDRLAWRGCTRFIVKNSYIASSTYILNRPRPAATASPSFLFVSAAELCCGRLGCGLWVMDVGRLGAAYEF